MNSFDFIYICMGLLLFMLGAISGIKIAAYFDKDEVTCVDDEYEPSVNNNVAYFNPDDNPIETPKKLSPAEKLVEMKKSLEFYHKGLEGSIDENTGGLRLFYRYALSSDNSTITLNKELLPSLVKYIERNFFIEETNNEECP